MSSTRSMVARPPREVGPLGLDRRVARGVGRWSTGVVLVSLLSSAAWAADPGATYRDPAAPVESRVSDLMSRLTIEEKARLLKTRNEGVPRVGIPAWGGWNQGLHGVWSDQDTTLFPVPIGLGATWNPELVRKIGAVIADEGRALYNIKATGPTFAADEGGGYRKLSSPHGLIYRSPVINISRDPRWGRVQETFSEDPLLTAEMGIAMIKGMQGDDPRHMKVAATLKHFAVNNVETDRMRLSAQVDQRNLYEFWLPHWKRVVVEAKPASIMSSYNAINGVPLAVNDELINGLLRKRWGFDGFVTADGGAVSLLSDQFKGQSYNDDPIVAAARALKAGTDTANEDYERDLPEAVRRKLVAEEDIDQALRRVLDVGFRLGVFDPEAASPYKALGQADIHSAAHRQLALQAASESLVLLRNDRAFLPFDVTKLKSVAVIGPTGDDGYEVGAYYNGAAKRVGVTSALRQIVPAGVSIAYERGAGILEPVDAAAIERAVRLAKSSDVVILCLGLDHNVESEGRDRRSLDLPAGQQRLLEAVQAANPKVALILFSGGSLSVAFAARQVPAIVQAWYPGEAGGTAIVRALTGMDNPSGRLPYTMYADLNGVPPQHEYDVSKGFTYQYFKGVPLYPFGHGLTYSRFQYSDLRTVDPSTAGAPIRLSFKVRNVSERAGVETAQIYTHSTAIEGARPIKKLQAFRRVSLGPDEVRDVIIDIPVARLAEYDEELRHGKVYKGVFDLLVGSSSLDIRLKGGFSISKDFDVAD